MKAKAQEKFHIRVKTELLRREETTVSLARKFGKSRTAVSRAIHSCECPRVRELICKELGVTDA